MNKRYLLVDGFNLYFRAIHVSHRATDLEEKVAFALHTTLQSIASAWHQLKGTHVVLALEGKSWRRSVYAPYKRNRDVKRSAATEKEKKEAEAFFEGFYKLVEFLDTRTNITVLQHPDLEADDLIAGWTQSHPEDHHVIISSDSDFHQLLSDTVTQYNGVEGELHTLQGIFNYNGKPVIDKKTSQPKKIPDPHFILFEKIVRGDSADNIFSAYPGVRTKGSKNKIGITEAFDDRHNKGFNYNNFMLQKWTDHNNVEHRVMDDFLRNQTLIDLTAQPPEIRAKINETISNAPSKSKPQLGVYFLKFCGKHDLIKISERPATYVEWMSATYQRS